MARALSRLPDTVVNETKCPQKYRAPGMHPDGGGLYLRVTPEGTRSWIFRFVLRGREHHMGLGPVHDVGLADARAEATACRRQLREGIDPIEARRAKRLERALEEARNVTFEACAEEYIEANKVSWKNAKHRDQWPSTLKRYAYPTIGKLPVRQIDTPMIMKILKQKVRSKSGEKSTLWSAKTETASRVRGRIETVLDHATTNHYREGPNPARWNGHLEMSLPAKSKIHEEKHHAALPYERASEFLLRLRERQGVAAQALELLFFTACRTTEVIEAPWSEFALDKKLWIIPKTRTKQKREHRVPLTPQALAIIEARKAVRSQDDVYVFPGLKPGKPLSNMAMLTLLQRDSEYADLTVHGLRSSFRDWVAEITNFQETIAEVALGHRVGDDTVRAYQRGDLLMKRRRMMEAWGRYCESTPASGNVVHAAFA
jgi:integrase